MSTYKRIYKSYYEAPYIMSVFSILISIMTSSLLVIITEGNILANIALGLGCLSVLGSVISAQKIRVTYDMTIISLFINLIILLIFL